MKKEYVILFTIISLFALSGCDVYNTLYVDQPSMEESSETINEEDIVTEEDLEELDTIEDDIDSDSEEVVDEDVSDEETTDEEPSEEVEEEINVPIEDDLQPTVDEDAVVVVVEETDRVSLAPQAEDPDNDVLFFTFTTPLDEDGEWQTTYGDAGEYTITVTASDGTLTASKQALIIVNRKEESPIIETITPVDLESEIDETDRVEFAVIASDLNDDDLSFTWELDGQEVSDTDSYRYQTTYDDAGEHTVTVRVTDGIFDAEEVWTITVINLNREPLLGTIDDIDARETDTIVLELDASDDDGDALTFTINDDRFLQDDNIFTWETTHDDSGEHIVTVDVTDGEDTTSQDIVIAVANVNRPPVILDIVQAE